MRGFPMLALLMAACGGSGDSTPPNTEVLSWSRSTYTTLDNLQLGDDVGDATSESQVLVISPQKQGMCDSSYADVRVRLDVDYGEVKEQMGDDTHLVPRRVSATVLDNDIWLIEGKCEPRVRVPEAPGFEDEGVPRVLRAECEITLQHHDDARLVSIEISGDENLEVTAGFDEVRVE